MEGYFFVYGTLLQEKVWRRLIGRSPIIEPATLNGFRRYQILSASYPGMWFCEGAQVAGGFVSDITQEESQTLDYYEGEEYQKIWVDIMVNGMKIKAKTYIRQPQSPQEWAEKYYLDT